MCQVRTQINMLSSQPTLERLFYMWGGSEPRCSGYKAACLESRRSRVRAPLWPSSFKKTECFFPAHPQRFNIVWNLRDQEEACSASDRQGSDFESCVCGVVSSHNPQEVFLAQFSLYVHKGSLKPHSFHFYRRVSYSVI